MPQLQVSVVLPYYLRLSESDYPTSPAGESIRVQAPQLLEGTPPHTPVQALFFHDGVEDINEIQRQKARDVDQFLRRINRLLRWYRSVSHRAEVIELTRAQAGPFEFTIIDGEGLPEWTTTFNVEATGPQPAQWTVEQTSKAIREGLSSGNDPAVADLFLLDAERALHQGRFRETVLFCWSTIDSVFNQKYDDLVDAAFVGEWGEARKFFKGFDFHLRNKMSAGMHFVAQRSLFREPDGLWQKLSNSYAKRNAIIHDGENASEDEARQALEVALRIVQIMGDV